MTYNEFEGKPPRWDNLSTRTKHPVPHAVSPRTFHCIILLLLLCVVCRLFWNKQTLSCIDDRLANWHPQHQQHLLVRRWLRHLNFGEGAEGQVLNKCVIESGPECRPLCSP